jgi:glucan phosphoethanolaminetransferase (alkaline phosphatase superfamily)
VRRHLLPATGIVAVPLTMTGLSGVGDAPDPHDPPASMAAHFLDARESVLAAAPFGYVGAALLLAFVLGLAARLRRGGEDRSATVVSTAGLLAAGYLATLQIVYTSLSYQVAAASPEATKALFVPTILAVPALGLVVAALLAAAARGGARTGLLPRWWSAVSAAAAAVAAVAVVSYADSDYFYPDVQQQWVGNILLLWTVGTAVVLATRGSPRRVDS